MHKRITDKLLTIYAVLFGMLVLIIPSWYMRHRTESTYFVRIGFRLGMLLSIIILLLEART